MGFVVNILGQIYERPPAKQHRKHVIREVSRVESVGAETKRQEQIIIQTEGYCGCSTRQNRLSNPSNQGFYKYRILQAG